MKKKRKKRKRCKSERGTAELHHRGDLHLNSDAI